ncbi:A disintegrin and metallopeptidase domain 3-like isoform X1 [Bos indicus]|uniref:A disintegrin and metallopeptidase domain 3-like isoform X1 n=1 Tax=Bos indicus TaxID=9915 RepID=A0A6P5AWV7_BOSIN|nr:A disintegrin and metallopeptidase domain 3-like [Bos indicus x Bos taurus]XP_061260527.1 A disintegrin and metallopeptidase domain 3-like isoform X3 [Bos javanicus]
MLSLLLLLTGLGQLASAGHHSETARLQITVPRKIETNTKDGSISETHVAYSIQIDKKTYTLPLEKQSFLDSNLLVYSYNKSRVLYPDSSFIKGHCFYQGYATEIPNSVVTLSTCSGLRGLLQFENVSYGIEPLESSTTYEHVIYPFRDKKSDFSPISADQSYKILVKSNKDSGVLLKRVLKIHVIIDKALYHYMGSEVALASEKIIYVFSLINTMYSQLQVSVILTSLEIWSDLNKISTDGDAHDVLQRFVSWREKSLLQSSHDLAYLLIYRDHPNYVGATYHGMACDPKFAAGLALYSKMITLEAFSVIFTQLLGIMLGLKYNNNIYECSCPGIACIMNPEAIRSHGIKFFSSCSIDEFKHTTSQPKFECLQNRTVPKVVPQGRQSICGNGVLEPPEQCDCGSMENCEHTKCCNPLNCVLIGNADCGSGPCCGKKTCMILDRGTECRRSTDPCDFPEFCNGISEFCVPDMRAADLQTCNNKSSYCFRGICQDRTKQCITLFGKYAKESSYQCTEEVNYQDDDFGNCLGRTCFFHQHLCGKLVCHWTHSAIVSRNDIDVQYTYLGGHICMSANLRTRRYPDPTVAANGSMCDENKFCDNGACRAIHQYTQYQDCDPLTKCKGHGICNTRLHCHCDVGYVPPDCEEIALSPGGSIDDGFWNLEIDESKTAYLIKRRRASQKNNLMISFYVLLPFFILTAIIALKWNKMKIFWNKEGTISGGSPSEISNSNSSQSNSND